LWDWCHFASRFGGESFSGNTAGPNRSFSRGGGGFGRSFGSSSFCGNLGRCGLFSRGFCLLRFGRFGKWLLFRLKRAIGKLDHVALMDEPMQISNQIGLLRSRLVAFDWRLRCLLGSRLGGFIRGGWLRRWRLRRSRRRGGQTFDELPPGALRFGINVI